MRSCVHQPSVSNGLIGGFPRVSTCVHAAVLTRKQLYKMRVGEKQSHLWGSVSGMHFLSQWSRSVMLKTLRQVKTGRAARGLPILCFALFKVLEQRAAGFTAPMDRWHPCNVAFRALFVEEVHNSGSIVSVASSLHEAGRSSSVAVTCC